MFEDLKSRARALKNEVFAVYLAAKDARSPWYAKVIAICTVAYALSPIDLIPDFIPILGYLDDVIIVPAGIALAIRLIPADALEEARETVRQAQGPGRSVGYVGFAFVVGVWVVILTGILCLIKFLS
ncbi:MAG TPA: YkvA family protein [Anaerolineales bacterium]